MRAVAEQVSSTRWEDVEIWLDHVTATERMRIQAGLTIATADYDMPTVLVKFVIPAWELTGLVTLLNGTVWSDSTTASKALALRAHPEGFDCVPPPGVEEGTPIYVRWKECCNRAEREYATFAKGLEAGDAAQCFLPNSLAHYVTANIRLDVLYELIRQVMSFYALPYVRPLKPLFRELLLTGYSFAPRLFEHLYYRYILKKMQSEVDDDAEMAGEGEGDPTPI